MKTPILGSSYVARSVNAADNRMVNLFPEVVPEGGKEPAFLNRAPGLALLATVGAGPIRGLREVAGDLYVVSGAALYKVTTVFGTTLIGAVDNSTSSIVSMSDNGLQLMVTSNGFGYIYNFQTTVFSTIVFPAGNVYGAGTVGFIDGKFVYNEPNTQVVWCTAVNNGLVTDFRDYRAAESSPDNVVAVITDHSEIWILGANSTEVWYNADMPNFPFLPIPGAFNEIGCAAVATVAKLDNTIFWLGKDKRGQGIVYRAKGFIAERVSTHAIEWQIQQYGDLSLAVAYTYQQDGHAFYVLTFPVQGVTWVYDVATQAWHERAGYSGGVFVRHRGNCQAFYNNITILGDYSNGKLYRLGLDLYDDAGTSQKWLRSWRALAPGENKLTRTAHHSLQLDCESGVGLSSGTGTDPQVSLRWSDDGGHTWSTPRAITMGTIGTYDTRVIWRRLGMTTKLRDRVYEVSGTDPVKIVIIGAELLMSNTNA